MYMYMYMYTFTITIDSHSMGHSIVERWVVYRQFNCGLYREVVSYYTHGCKSFWDMLNKEGDA